MNLWWEHGTTHIVTSSSCGGVLCCYTFESVLGGDPSGPTLVSDHPPLATTESFHFGWSPTPLKYKNKSQDPKVFSTAIRITSVERCTDLILVT